jgi:uncharacterized protein YdbL (DUF1318 family)
MKVTLKADTHQYFDQQGREYKSATRFLGSFKEEFDAQKIAPLVAKARAKKLKELAKKRKTTVKVIQAEQPLYERGITMDAVLKEWDAKRDAANEKGTRIHDNLENMIKSGMLPQTHLDNTDEDRIYTDVWDFLKRQEYYKLFPEVILHTERIMVAGMADLRCQRQNSRNPENIIIDYYDYKTNVIGFDSRAIKEGKMKHYNRFMNYPIDHLEDCEYNKYALQLSLYAYMDQMLHNVRIGRLAILNVVNDCLEVIPVPYMRETVETLIRYTELNNER